MCLRDASGSCCRKKILLCGLHLLSVYGENGLIICLPQREWANNLTPGIIQALPELIYHHQPTGLRQLDGSAPQVISLGLAS